MLISDLSENNYNKYSGILQIQHLNEQGDIIHITDAPNIITYEARTILTYLIAGQTLSNKYISNLVAGDDATAPDRNDTALGNQVGSVGLTYTFPAADRVVFEGILTSSTANGYILTEAGLTNLDNQLFARQTYGVIAKTDAIQLKYKWTIIFS